MNTGSFEDHRDIERLILLYPYFLDNARFEQMGQLFAHADVYAGGTLAARHDPAAVADLWRSFVRIHSNGTPRTHHIATNVLIDFDDQNHARAHSYILVVQHTRNLPLAPITAGDYLDRFAKIDGEWRFTERHVGNDLFGDMTDHLLQPMQTTHDLRPQRWPDFP
ncbi:nuclear transport factor 2 family protein [Rhodococcus sp. 077-4]|uniref:nuclear transport factor 2 family protein n=1 Tax=Rhodococcus sp. 077-4 TaxID=2789271 RepID=UPI0039F51863